MRCPIGAIIEDVIEEYPHKITKLTIEDVVHGHLECRWSIRHAEGHDVKFIMFVTCLEGHGFNRVVSHTNLVEAEGRSSLVKNCE